VSAGSAGRRLLIRRDANGEERGQTARDNASDGDKNVSMEPRSKTKIAALLSDVRTFHTRNMSKVIL